MLRILLSSWSLQQAARERTTMARQQRFAAFFLCLIFSGPKISVAQRTFNIVNQCAFTVWPGTLSNAGMAVLWQGGTTVAAGATFQYVAPAGWAGRLWGRGGCSFDSSGAGVCATGDCGSGLYCNGAGGTPPATLAEFTLDGYGGQDFYDVSLVDGYNFPLAITSTGGTAQNGTCGSPGCVSDLNLSCPSELQEVVNGTVVACKSACEAFGTANYCCTGAYDTPQTCPPTSYSMIFKSACPTAYSYAYDDASSTFTCQGPSAYTVTFCPSGTSVGSPTPIVMQSPPPPTLGTTPPPPTTSGIAPPPPPIEIVPPPPPSTTGLTPPPPPNTAGLAPPPPNTTGLTPPPPPTAALTPPPPNTTGLTPPPPTTGLIPPPPNTIGPSPPPPPLAGSVSPPLAITGLIPGSPAEAPLTMSYGASSSAAGSSFPFLWQKAFFSMAAAVAIALFSIGRQ